MVIVQKANLNHFNYIVEVMLNSYSNADFYFATLSYQIKIITLFQLDLLPSK